ncbi:hypothetical protein [Caulobacter sp.]|jgi:hypothetical protein|uniref:hypothetical protein n=1 Tax=Caulobacter sp. TaxID=78 RepID=UPI0016174DC0
MATAADKRRALRGMLGDPRFSYGPAREVESAVFGVPPTLPLDVPKPSLDAILARVSRRAKAGKERESCLQVVKLLHGEAVELNLCATEEPFLPLQLGLGISTSFCAGLILSDQHRVWVPATNYRRTPLGREALRFAFSVMHEQSRALNDDLRAAELSFVQFPHPKRSARRCTITVAGEMRLFSYDQLSEMVRETYLIWDDVRQEHEERRRATGTDGADWWG